MEQNRWQKIRIPYPTERGYLPLTSTMWLGFTNGILADTTWRWNVPAWWGLLSCASDIAMTSSSLGSQLVQAIWETHGQTWTRPTTFNCPAGLDQLTHRCVINTCLILRKGGKTQNWDSFTKRQINKRKTNDLLTCPVHVTWEKPKPKVTQIVA